MPKNNELTREQEARKLYLFFKQSLTPDEMQELKELLGESDELKPGPVAGE